MAVLIGTTYKPFVLGAILGDDHTSNFPNTVWLALSTTMPTVGSTLSEPGDSAYGRQSIANTSAQFPISGGQLSNGTLIQYGTATADWGTIGYWAVMTASTAGLVILADAFSGGSLHVTVGMAPYIAVGQMVLAA